MTATAVERLSVVTEIPRGTGESGYLATDGRVYRRTTGLLQALVPMDKWFGHEWGLRSEPPRTAWLETWDRTAVPPGWVLRWLWEKLLKRWEREVAVLMGRTAEGRWVFVIPKQETTWGSVDFDDPEAARTLWAAGANQMGIVHKHPGQMTAFSRGEHADEGTFCANAGIHPIITQDGTAAGIHASVAGWVWTLIERMDLTEERPQDARSPRILTSGGRKLDELVKEPKFQFHQGPPQTKGAVWEQGPDGTWYRVAGDAEVGTPAERNRTRWDTNKEPPKADNERTKERRYVPWVPSWAIRLDDLVALRAFRNEDQVFLAEEKNVPDLWSTDIDWELTGKIQDLCLGKSSAESAHASEVWDAVNEPLTMANVAVVRTDDEIVLMSREQADQWNLDRDLATETAIIEAMELGTYQALADWYAQQDSKGAVDDDDLIGGYER